MSYIGITKKQFDETLKVEKGWICNILGNEYVYDYHLLQSPIIIKVASSIRIDTNKARKKGADAIRVYAVKKDGMNVKAKIVCGLVKSKSVYRTDNWRTNLQMAFISVRNSAKAVYTKKNNLKMGI